MTSTKNFAFFYPLPSLSLSQIVPFICFLGTPLPPTHCGLCGLWTSYMEAPLQFPLTIMGLNAMQGSGSNGNCPTGGRMEDDVDDSTE